MQTKTLENSLLEEFNRFFQGNAKAVIKEDRLEITIGTRTMIISLPVVIGGQSTGQS